MTAPKNMMALSGPPLWKCDECGESKIESPWHCSGPMTPYVKVSPPLDLPEGIESILFSLAGRAYCDICQEWDHDCGCKPDVNQRSTKAALEKIAAIRALASSPPQAAAFKEPDENLCQYSHVNHRGVISAVDHDGGVFIRPDATLEELRAALLAVLSDEGVPLPEPAAPPHAGGRDLAWTKEKEEAYIAMEKAIGAVRMWAKAKDQTHMDHAMLFTRLAADALKKVPEPLDGSRKPVAGADAPSEGK